MGKPSFEGWRFETTSSTANDGASLSNEEAISFSAQPQPDWPPLRTARAAACRFDASEARSCPQPRPALCGNSLKAARPLQTEPEPSPGATLPFPARSQFALNGR